MKNLTNHENTDGMGQAGHVMADADYQAMSTNANTYNEPVDPALPTALNFVGTTSEGRAIMQHQNKEEWKNKEKRDEAKTSGLNLQHRNEKRARIRRRGGTRRVFL